MLILVSHARRGMENDQPPRFHPCFSFKQCSSYVIYPNINLLISVRCNHLCRSLLPCFVQEQIKYFPKNLFLCCLSPGRNSWCFSYWSQALCSFSILLSQSDFVLKCAHCPAPGPFSAEVFLCQVFPPKYLIFTTKLRKLIENTFQIDLPLCWSCIRQVWTLVCISSPYENTKYKKVWTAFIKYT